MTETQRRGGQKANYSVKGGFSDENPPFVYYWYTCVSSPNIFSKLIRPLSSFCCFACL